MKKIMWLLVGLAIGVLLGAIRGNEDRSDSFSYATKAYCDGEFCEDQYVLQCNDLSYSLPTGFKIRMAVPADGGISQETKIEEQ